jgi:hypothetical protein
VATSRPPFSLEGLPVIVQVGDTSVEVRAEAVLSAPRFGPLTNVFAFVESLMPLHIRPTLGQGAFWAQVLTRMLEEFSDKTEYIITLDYDTFVTRSDVERMFAIAMTCQCDALAPIQAKREDGRPMLTLLDTMDDPPADGKTELPLSWFAEPVQQVDTAHFGCTVISTRALRRTLKPWFHSKPDAEGGWGDGRIDDDLWFWRQFRASGNRLFITPRVVIGHGEYVISWPSKDFLGPVFQHTTNWQRTKKPPETAWRVGE